MEPLPVVSTQRSFENCGRRHSWSTNSLIDAIVATILDFNNHVEVTKSLLLTKCTPMKKVPSIMVAWSVQHRWSVCRRPLYLLSVLAGRSIKVGQCPWRLV